MGYTPTIASTMRKQSLTNGFRVPSQAQMEVSVYPNLRMIHKGKSESNMDDLGVPLFRETSIWVLKLDRS